MNRVNWFLYGFFFCYFLLSVSRVMSKSPQLSTNHGTLSAVDSELNNIFLTMQPREHDIVPSTPTVNGMSSLHIVFYATGTALNSFTMYNGSRYYQPWTRMP